jgi:UDP-GlcNAc3NAcA epimerase
MLEVLTVVGARPQFIKAAVLSRLIRSEDYRLRIRETLVHTGQHYDENMSEIFFREMQIPKPDVNLNVGSGTHGAMTGLMLQGLETLILNKKPDVVLVYGDTNSTLAGALAASKQHVPVAHVEAGLRSFMMVMPEEQNRRLTDHLSSWLFCPTETAVSNLRKEGIENSDVIKPNPDSKSVSMTGDVMLDASLHYRKTSRFKAGEILKGLSEGFCLMTIHRAENTDDPVRLSAIVNAINSVTDRPVIFPIHPRTHKILAKNGIAFAKHVRLIDPIGYYEMLCLEEDCSFVITDSGGVQKEAFFFGKPCITMRDSTEWVELVESGWNTLVGADRDKIVGAMRGIQIPAGRTNLYGDGHAGINILNSRLR